MQWACTVALTDDIAIDLQRMISTSDILQYVQSTEIKDTLVTITGSGYVFFVYYLLFLSMINIADLAFTLHWQYLHSSYWILKRRNPTPFPFQY